MGFGGGALIGGPSANMLMGYFHTSTSIGVWEYLLVLAAVYDVFMLAGVFGYRVPPANWQPEHWINSAA